jgi:outer membrane protein TolC
MSKRKTLLFFSLIIIFLSSSLAQQGVKELSLKDCILHAVKNNLGVAVEVLNPELRDISISQAREKFLPSLRFSFQRRETNTASYSWIEAADQMTVSYDYYEAVISQAIPTGGSFSVSLDTYKNYSNRKYQTFNPVFGSTFGFSLTQPLLKDFGFRVARKDILLAYNNREISEKDLKKALLDTIYTVEEAYWSLVSSVENLEVNKQSLKLARDLLVKNQKEVKIGTLAPKETLSSQAEVARREADILQAEALVKDSSARLKVIINLPDGERSTEIIPVDKPVFEKREVNQEEAFRTALENRPDLQALRIALKNREIDLGYARNQLLPSLDLRAEYWSPGISGTEILYFGGNPLTGNVIGTNPKGVSGALKDAFNFKYRNWSISLTLDIPFNTFFSRASYANAKVSIKQAELTLKKLEQQAFLEIENVVRAVDTDYKRVHAYTSARELAEKKLEAEESKLKAGLSSNYFVLTYQRDLTLARTAELRALIDYNLSLSQLDRALGITLENRNIRISDVGSGLSY